MRPMWRIGTLTGVGWFSLLRRVPVRDWPMVIRNVWVQNHS